MSQIGFIGQGWIGKHYADEFESRGLSVIRYALEAPYNQNKTKIASCEIVFIAVPTPTTTDGFIDTAVRDALTCVGKGKTAVIKSTLLPGTTKKLQADFPEIFVFHSPEFLAEKTAAHDALNPNRNLIGIPEDNAEYRDRAEAVLKLLPKAPYQQIMDSTDAEVVKYAGNCFLFTKVVYMNILYDTVKALGGDWEKVREAFVNDPRIGSSHTSPVHSSGHVNDTKVVHRGAGGHCFIKDFEAFRRLYDDVVDNESGEEVLRALVNLNIELLMSSSKDLDLLTGVYGEELKPR